MGRRTQNYINQSEAESNRYIGRAMSVIVFVIIFTEVLNEIGLYRIDKFLMRSSMSILFLLYIGLLFFSENPKFRQKSMTKYIIIGFSLLITFAEYSLLNFHAVLSLIIPLLLAEFYHSRKITVFAFLGSVFCAVVGPFVGLMLGTWEVTFFAWIMSVIDPNALTQYAYVTMQDNIISGWKGVFVYIAVPNSAYILLYGVVALGENMNRRKRQLSEIKTILSMKDNILYSMADVIESRDSSTGGHVKRTRDVIRIYVDYIKENKIPGLELDDELADNLIKAAPMHDLGKLTISDTILCKPGRLTDEEFEIIKTHPAKSVEIINKVLNKVEDESMLETARNIALYHHEKYNGTGYPEKLVGDAIPIEARIMAVVDVYDALVSKRCYKEPVSFEEAYNIIMDSMGTHFDPKLAVVVEACRAEVEKCY